MSGIFNPAIFNNTVFNTGTAGPVVEEVVKTGTGGIDPDKRRRIYKPTGLLARKKENQVEQRVRESREIHREVFEEVIQANLERLEFKPVEDMTPREIDREIGLLMREKLRAEDVEDMMTVIMMAADE